MRACRACREFQAALGERRAGLAALAPAPPAVAGATWLSRLLAATGGSSAGGASWITGTVATKAIVVVVGAAAVAGTATAVPEVRSRPASTPRSHPAAQRAVGVRDAVSRTTQPPVLLSRVPPPRARAGHGEAATVHEPVTTVPLPKPSAGERAATAARRGAAKSASKHPHPPHPSAAPQAGKHAHPAHGSAAQPATKPHGPRKATSPAKPAHGVRAGRAGHAPPAPPGQAKTPESVPAAPAAADSKGHGPAAGTPPEHAASEHAPKTK